MCFFNEYEQLAILDREFSKIPQKGSKHANLEYKLPGDSNRLKAETQELQELRVHACVVAVGLGYRGVNEYLVLKETDLEKIYDLSPNKFIRIPLLGISIERLHKSVMNAVMDYFRQVDKDYDLKILGSRILPTDILPILIDKNASNKYISKLLSNDEYYEELVAILIMKNQFKTVYHLL